MKKIKNFIIFTINFINSNSISKYLFTIGLCLFIVFLFGMFTSDTITNLLSIFFGFIISHLTLGIFRVISIKLEDTIKVSQDTKKLSSIYTDEKVKKVVKLNGTETTVLYNDLIVNKNFKIKVKDNKDKVFQPDDFIMDNFHDLLKAHQYSTISNMLTVRLDACEKTSNDEFTLTLSRSTYFNHLITNRAADYKLESGISLRDYYEYGTNITSLENSVMSNHLGIIALVYLKDGELLLPRRKENSTISKNKITSSIATRLNIPKDNTSITSDYLMKECILDGLVSRTNIDADYLKKGQVDIEFLGCGQDIYEVGKPHLYYKVFLKNIDRKDYLTHLVSKKKQKEIDEDKFIYVANKDTLKFASDNINFEYYKAKIVKGKYKEKLKKVKCSYEKAFACNIWHENQQ